jgi:hypothetical protein
LGVSGRPNSASDGSPLPFVASPRTWSYLRFSLMMKTTCLTPARTLAMVAASLALSVCEKLLFVATWLVSVASCAGAGTG